VKIEVNFGRGEECPPKCVKISNLKPEGGWTLPKRFYLQGRF